MLTAAPALLALDHVCLAGGEGWATRAGRLLLATMGWDPIYKVPMGLGYSLTQPCSVIRTICETLMKYSIVI